MTTNNSYTPVEGECIGLDVGDERIGVARVNTQARIAEPLSIIQNNDPEVFQDVLTLVDSLEATAIVVGLPRGLDGQETEQTQKTRAFTEKLKSTLQIPVYMIDEAGSTKDALVKQKSYPNASLDSLAAMIIVEDFIQSANKSELQA